MIHGRRCRDKRGSGQGGEGGRRREAAFRSWLDAYGRAWEARDPEAARDLYAEDATYQVTPFVEPLRGRAAIFDYWSHVCQTEEDIRFGYEVLAVTPEVGIARWWARFRRVPPGLETQLEGIFVITLDSEHRCQTLREWWVKHQKQSHHVYS